MCGRRVSRHVLVNPAAQIRRGRARSPRDRFGRDLAVDERNAGGPPPPLARLTLPTTPATGLSNTLVLGMLAVAPAGDLVAYVGTAGVPLDVRPPFRSTGGHAVPNTASVGGPFFSPDGRWLAYQTAGPSGGLVKMLLATGTVTTICALPAQMRGAVWAPEARSSSDPAPGRSIASAPTAARLSRSRRFARESMRIGGRRCCQTASTCCSPAEPRPYVGNRRTSKY